MEAWRAARRARLLLPDGWLSVIGLHWLDDGVHALGSAPSASVPLPSGPSRAGTIRVRGGAVVLEAEPGGGLTHQGEPVTTMPLETDVAGRPTVVELGALRLHVIDRGGRIALRVKDTARPAQVGLAEIPSFPASAAWRLPARLDASTAEPVLRVATMADAIEVRSSPGDLLLSHEGATHRLRAFDEEPGGPWLVVFADGTSGTETYGGGRFVYVARPSAGDEVTIDFNRAYNPPCVFTPHATCPLPPRGNRLPFRVEAGEKSYPG